LPTDVSVETRAPSIRAVIGPIAVSTAFVIDLTLVPMLLPAIQVFFQISVSELAWVFNAYGAAVACGVILGGWLGDLFGLRRVFAAGIVAFAIGAIVVACARDFNILIAGRVLQGFGGGVFSPLVPVLLTRAFPEQPGKILIIWGSITGYVAASAPILLGGMIADTGWQTAFFLFALISAAALTLNWKTLPESQERTRKAPTNLRALFRAQNLWLVYAYIFCTYGAITFYLFRTPLWLVEMSHSVNATGVVLSVFWLSFSIVSTLLRNVVDGPTVRSVMLASPLLIALSFIVLFISTDLVWAMFSAAMIGTGFACSNAPSTQLVLRMAPRQMSAFSASLDITFARAGGIATVAFLAQSSFEFSLAAIFGIALLAILALVAVKEA
jgi:predicted MFS family arabinose efflux permease